MKGFCVTLARGLEAVEVSEPDAFGSVRVVGSRVLLRRGVDFFTDRAEALARLKSLAKYQIVRLERRIANIRDMLARS